MNLTYWKIKHGSIFLSGASKQTTSLKVSRLRHFVFMI